MMTQVSKLLLTGLPACGKTTTIIRLAELLKGRSIAGFYTEEVLSAGQRIGFQIKTFSGSQGLLGSLQTKSPYWVGRYGVDVRGFEQLVLPELEPAGRRVDVFLIDEIGKMECFSAHFIQAVQGLLEGPVPVVATVALKGKGFVEDVKALDSVKILHVTAQNREALPDQILQRLALE